MGKYILLVVSSLLFGLVILSQQSQKTSLETNEKQVERQKEAIARQIARSAFGLGVSQLKIDFETWRVDRTNVDYEKGTFDLSSSGAAEGPVTLTAVGNYNGTEYQIEGTIVRDVKGFNGLGVQGPLSSLKTAGSSFLISGLDTDPVLQGEDPVHGSGSGIDGHGMKLTDEAAADLAKGEFSADQVVGKEGNGDIVHKPLEVDLDALQKEIESSTTHTAAALDDDVGTKENPAIIAVDGDVDLSGNMHGIGALFVKGNFRMRGNAQWDGIVLVSGGDAAVDTEGDIAGNARIFGSLLHHNEAAGTLEFRGNVRVQYSSEAIKVLQEILPTVDESVTVQVTNRQGGVLSSTE